jgi:hypothetical protein
MNKKFTFPKNLSETVNYVNFFQKEKYVIRNNLHDLKK